MAELVDVHVCIVLRQFRRFIRSLRFLPSVVFVAYEPAAQGAVSLATAVPSREVLEVEGEEKRSSSSNRPQ